MEELAAIGTLLSTVITTTLVMAENGSEEHGPIITCRTFTEKDNAVAFGKLWKDNSPKNRSCVVLNYPKNKNV